MMFLKYANLVVRFLLELCMLAAFAYWGFWIGSGTAGKIVLGIGVPLLAAVLWGLFAARKAMIRLPQSAHFIAGLMMMMLLLAAVALAQAGQATAAVIFALIVVLNATLLIVWKQ